MAFARGLVHSLIVIELQSPHGPTGKEVAPVAKDDVVDAAFLDGRLDVAHGFYPPLENRRSLVAVEPIGVVVFVENEGFDSIVVPPGRGEPADDFDVSIRETSATMRTA